MATEALNRSSEASARLAMRWGPHLWKTLLLFLALRDAGSPLHTLNTDVVGAILYSILVDCGFGPLTIHSPQAPWAQLLIKRAVVATDEPRRQPRAIAPGQRSLSWPLARRMRLRPPPRRSKSF